jgi:hypothetical protein
MEILTVLEDGSAKKMLNYNPLGALELCTMDFDCGVTLKTHHHN